MSEFGYKPLGTADQDEELWVEARKDIAALLAENAKLKAELDKLTIVLEEFGFMAAAEEKLRMERETALPAFRKTLKMREEKMFK